MGNEDFVDRQTYVVPRSLAGKPLAGFRATPFRRITDLTGKNLRMLCLGGFSSHRRMLCGL